MQKKTYFKATGEPVYTGEPMTIELDSFGVKHAISVSNLTEEFAEELVDSRFLYRYNPKPTSDKEDTKVPSDLAYYITKISKHMGLPVRYTAYILDNIFRIHPHAVLNMLMREIAIELDSKYPDHIKNCETLYALSATEGRIVALTNKNIKGYKAFAAFRTMEDAKFACRIMSPFIRSMFSKKEHGK